MASRMRLAVLAEAGEDAWMQETRDSLQQAFDAQHAGAAEELRLFITRVRQRLDRRGEGTLILIEWTQSQVDPWLRGINGGTVAALAATYTGLQERLRFLWALFGTPARDRMGQALVEAAVAVSGAAAADSQGLEPLSKLALRLVDMAGCVRGGERKLLSQLFGAFSPPLAERVLIEVGQLDFFDAFAEDLALSLPLAGKDTAIPFAGAFAAGSSIRLRQLLEGMAVHLRRPELSWQPKTPSADSVRTWCIALQRAMSTRAPRLQGLLDSLLESLREHDRELAAITAAYLNARPLNHEDVFNLFSATGKKARGAPPESWGLPSVTFRETGSMRGSSLFAEKGTPSTEAPDFDWTPALRHVDRAALKQAVLAQPSPEFALAYLRQLKDVGHPEFDALCTELCATEKFRSRLFGVTGTMAAVVILRLQEVKYGSQALQALYQALLPELVPLMPTEFFVRLDPNTLTQDFATRELEARLPRVEKLRDLDTLLELGGVFLPERRFSELLDEVPFPRLCPQESASDEQLSDWLYGTAHLLSVEELEQTDPVPRLLKCLPTSLFQRLYRLEPMGTKEHETHWSTQTRQLLKGLLVEEWARREPEVLAQALQENGDRDVTFWFFAFLPHGGEEARILASAEYRWLKTLAVLAPDLVSGYLHALLKSAWMPVPANRLGPSLEVAAEFTNLWLSARGEQAPPAFWEVLLERLSQLPEDAGVEAAAFAAVELPAPPEQLRAFREKALPEVRKRLRVEQTLEPRGSIKRLQEVLRRDAPGLWETLVERAS
jgi:hypothetical protein